MTDTIIQEQIAYYRARAGEYDEWFYRVGRYDHGEDSNRQWFAEAETVMGALAGIGPVTHGLELAAGTGIWTRELAKIAARVTAVDASPEVLSINRSKLDANHVDYVVADLFTWEPERAYDLVLFTFWLSHVPPERMDTFLATVARATRPGGHVFLVDGRPVQATTAHDQQIPRQGPLMTRRLNDGREYQIVKVFYTPAELDAMLARHGFAVEARQTANYFVYAHAIQNGT